MLLGDRLNYNSEAGDILQRGCSSLVHEVCNCRSSGRITLMNDSQAKQRVQYTGGKSDNLQKDKAGHLGRHLGRPGWMSG